MDLKIDFATRDHARTPQGWPIRIDGAEEAAQNILLRLAPDRHRLPLRPRRRPGGGGLHLLLAKPGAENHRDDMKKGRPGNEVL